MKKKTLLSLLFALPLAAAAQNLQFHYDLGRMMYDDLSTRPRVTTTIDCFKADKWGSTYFFCDLNYMSDGLTDAYWEVSREINFTRNKRFAAHVEYNGGELTGKGGGSYYGNRYQHAVLLGPAWNWASADYSQTFSGQAMYKYYCKNQHRGLHPYNGFQLTEVWGLTFASKLCTFSGFCDLWYDPNVNGKLILLSEPQFWFNLNTIKGLDGFNLSLGSEVEISNNFVFDNEGHNNAFYVIPTIAAKWTF